MAGLDDLDLDDMFNDDGDNLFDGLDIELDGTMGDIISNEKSQITAAVVAPPPKPRRTGGPRTKRTNPMLEKEEMEAAASGDGSSKRRKTKRKSKAPTPFGDEEDVDTQAALIEMHQPKKKRKAALKAKKATEELAIANQAKSTTAPVVNVNTAKRKKKGAAATAAAAVATASASTAITTSTGIPSIKANSTTSGNLALQTKLPTVAAAGRFGSGGLKRGTSTGAGAGAGPKTKKVKRKIKKTSTGTTTATATDSGTKQQAPTAAPSQPRIPPPKAESTDCGIPPSRVLFYPFLDGVPKQATLQKRKAYPMLDKLSSVLTSTIANSSSSSSSANAKEATGNGAEPGNDITNGSTNRTSTEHSAIFKLMLETYGGLSDKEKAGSEEKRAALLSGMPKLRETVEGLDKTKLVKDVFSVCWLLTRQYNLLKLSLENMENWCKDTFTEEDYEATYEEEEEIAKQKLRKWASATVKVKIALTGYREPKGVSPLEASLPPFAVAPPSVTSNKAAPTTAAGPKIAPSDASAVTTSSKPKKRKSSTAASTAKPPAAAKAKVEPLTPYPSLIPVVTKEPKTYADASAQTRRQLIMDRISYLATELEHVARQAPAGSAGQPTLNRNLESIPTEDPPLHTTRMWEWLQSAGFYRPLDQLSLRRLALHRAPEVHPRGHFLTTATRIQSSDDNKKPIRSDTNEGDYDMIEEEAEIKVSPESLFDRLQALLVEEDMETNERRTKNSIDIRLKSTVEKSNYESDELDEEADEESLGFLDDDDNFHELNTQNGSASSIAERDSPPSVVDLSRLSVEERTFVHLLSAGLIQQPIFPTVKLAKAAKKKMDEGADDSDDLVRVVGEMALDLSKMTSRNNSRIAFLQASTTGSDLIYNKKVEEEQASAIARCQNLLKRNKERAKKAKQKKVDSLNLNLPW
jgi:hypothetical protein